MEKNQEQVGKDMPREVLGMLADLSRKLYKGEITASQLSHFLKEPEHSNTTTPSVCQEILTIVVNWDRTIADGVKAGRYSLYDRDINDKNFNRTGRGSKKTSIILLHFGKELTSDEARKEIEGRNLRPATLQELLAIGEKFPEKQEQFPIVALGSNWRQLGTRYITYLFVNSSGRKINLIWDGLDWTKICRFAAVPK